MQVSNRFTSSASVKGYSSNAMPYLNRDTVFNKPSSYQDQWGLLSFFGRATYDYDQRYLASLSLRADASRRFRPGKQYDYFPAVGLG